MLNVHLNFHLYELFEKRLYFVLFLISFRILYVRIIIFKTPIVLFAIENIIRLENYTYRCDSINMRFILVHYSRERRALHSIVAPTSNYWN